MEDGLVLDVEAPDGTKRAVLILVVVEDGLVPCIQGYHGGWSYSLNPCCSGRWSRTIRMRVEGLTPDKS